MSLDGDTCCCGRRYAESGGRSGHRCPAGKRNICEECATNGKGECPTHRVKTSW